MLGFLTYEGKVAVALAVFYMFYRLLLKKETFHRFNRAVLVGTAVLSFLLPLCVITIRKPMEMAPVGLVEALELGELPASEPAAVTAVRASASAPWWPTALTLIFFAGVAFVLLRLAVSVLSILRIIRRGTCVGEEDGCRIIVTQWNIDPFSWMRYIVLSRKDWEGPHDAILTHEKAHIAYGHSADLLLVSILSAFQWFNPAIWMLRADLQELHEYEADDAVLRSGANIRDYQYLLIRKAVGKSGYSVANSFNHSILKNRITMMSKTRSPLARGLRALWLLPLVCLGLGLQAQTIYVPVDKDSEKILPDEKKKSLLEEIVVVTYAADGVTSDQIRHAKDPERNPVAEPGNPDVDTPPVFSEENFSMWLNRRIAYPKGCLYEGNVVVGFTVNENGNVEDIQVLRSLCEELDNLIVDLVKQSPAWTPAIRNGKPVPYRMAIPVTFMIRTSKPSGVSAQQEAVKLTIKADGSILAEKGIIPLDEVAAYLDGLGVSESSYQKKVRIYAASDVKMGFIDDLKTALRQVKGVKLFYSLEGGEKVNIMMPLAPTPQGTKDAKYPPEDWPGVARENICRALLNKDDKIFFDDGAYQDDATILSHGVKFIEKHGRDALFVMRHDRGSSFGAYLHLQNLVLQSYDQARDAKAQEVYGKPMSELTTEEKNQINWLIPYSISESEPKSR